MAIDPSLPLRQAVISHLRADSSVTARIPAQRIYGERTPARPTWPFLRYGISDAVPRRQSCSDGAVVTVPIHAFSKTAGTDEVTGITRAVSSSLDGAILTLSDQRLAQLVWKRNQIRSDAKGAWQGIVTITGTVA